VVNTALGAIGVPAEDQVMQLHLPESMRPTDPYAQLGAEIGPYLSLGSVLSVLRRRWPLRRVLAAQSVLRLRG
jgi:hypothetical protein